MSRRRVMKIQENNPLAQVKEESNEESEKDKEDDIKVTEFKLQLEPDIQVDENDARPSVEPVNRQNENPEDMSNHIELPIEDDLDIDNDYQGIEDEVQEMFRKRETSSFDIKRRHSSVSESKIKHVEDLLDEDDRDIEEMCRNENQNLESKNATSLKQLPNISEPLDYSNAREHYSDNEESKQLIFRSNQKFNRHTSESNSSMKMSSDSSSSLKLQPNEENDHDDIFMNSQDSGDDSDLLKVEESQYNKKRKKRRLMQKSITQILPPIESDESNNIFDTKMGDFNRLGDIQIPLKKSASGHPAGSFTRIKNDGLDKLVKEYEDNDKLRDEMNRRHIIKKFNEIKSKTYIQPEVNLETPTQGPSDKKKYVMHVTESELKIIRKNRNLLLDLGAMLFWDHKYDNLRNDHAYFHHAEPLNEKKIEFQISGNFSEVERAKEAVIFLLNYERKIEKEQVVLIEIDMWIPKILIRKVVGYQEKNLIEYYKKFDVSISYEASLMNDESYPIHEDTMITIKGKKAFSEIVAADINAKVAKLIVRTIHLAPADCKYLKEKICQLKCRIDPAELRICRTTKQQKSLNMNHPFFHIPAYYKEVLIIGDKPEVSKAEAEIYKFLREEQKSSSKNMYTLSILIPFTIQPSEYNTWVDRIKEKYTIDLQTYDAVPPRKHATAMLVGTWENICLAKDMMVEWVEKQRGMQVSRWSDYDKFDKMILNQQIRFTYKSLKRYIIEKHVKYLKHWDLTSNTVTRKIDQPPEHDKEAMEFYKMAKGETESLKFFMKHVDNETAINVLFASKPQGEFARLMDKYDLKKREIIEKCYELLVENMSSYLRYNEGSYSNYNSHYNDNYNAPNRYEHSNRFYKPGYFDNTRRNYTGSYHHEGYNDAAQEHKTYTGRFKNLFSEGTPNQVVEQQQKSSAEKPRSQTPDRHRTYRHEYSEIYRDKHEPRLRHYEEGRHSTSRNTYTESKSREISRHSHSKSRRERHRRSSSRRSRRSSSRRRRHY